MKAFFYKCIAMMAFSVAHDCTILRTTLNKER